MKLWGLTDKQNTGSVLKTFREGKGGEGKEKGMMSKVRKKERRERAKENEKERQKFSFKSQVSDSLP